MNAWNAPTPRAKISRPRVALLRRELRTVKLQIRNCDQPEINGAALRVTTRDRRNARQLTAAVLTQAREHARLNAARGHNRPGQARADPTECDTRYAREPRGVRAETSARGNSPIIATPERTIRLSRYL